MPEKKYHVIFHHGWGLSPDLWKTWEPFLKNESIKSFISRGYFGSPSKSERFNQSLKKILVCHSLGLHIVSPELIKHSNALIIFGGFNGFHGEKGFSHRLSQKIVKAMQTQMIKKPEQVVRTFYTNCGLRPPQSFEYLNKNLLLEDLIHLDQNELDLKIFDNTEKILLIHGENDKIVLLERAAALHKELANSDLLIHKEGGHGLPFTHEKECMRLVLNSNCFKRLIK